MPLERPNNSKKSGFLIRLGGLPPAIDLRANPDLGKIGLHKNQFFKKPHLTAKPKKPVFENSR